MQRKFEKTFHSKRGTFLPETKHTNASKYLLPTEREKLSAMIHPEKRSQFIDDCSIRRTTSLRRYALTPYSYMLTNLTLQDPATDRQPIPGTVLLKRVAPAWNKFRWASCASSSERLRFPVTSTLFRTAKVTELWVAMCVSEENALPEKRRNAGLRNGRRL